MVSPGLPTVVDGRSSDFGMADSPSEFLPALAYRLGFETTYVKRYMKSVSCFGMRERAVL
jgi:hypothetical protein